MKAYPKATSAQMVSHGHARFTVLTDSMIRLEWSKQKQFEDRPTLSVGNRRVTARVDFKQKVRGDVLTLNTGAVTLEYRETGRPFSKSNVRITFKMDGRKQVWTPGKKNNGNLGGTVRTLDACDGAEYCKWDPNGPKPTGTHIDLGEGLLSRDGWALVDDSRTLPLSKREDGRWWVSPLADEDSRTDWYWLGYGHRYRQALAEASRVFGRQPLPPRFVFGYWFSRYWAYTDTELEEIVDRFDAMNVPLDVLVVDMDWHLLGWTGYTWEKAFFPDPARFLKGLRERGLKITLNLHPADGVHREEEAFAEMCKALGADPSRGETIPFDCTDLDYMDAYFKYLHHPHEKIGVDFWWMDWQQGSKSGLPGLDPLPWLNRLHWRDMEESADRRRPLIFSRYGGIGSGRYPIGFSGDTYSSWKSLALQPSLTAMANNVLYGYWSHDIGGHDGHGLTPELYTRWVQFGAFSPVLRTHCSKNPAFERRFWKYPDPYSASMEETVRQRYERAPYIYSECRKVCDTGISLLYPMYIDHPETPEAYQCPHQYMFGESMLVAPITAPITDPDDMIEQKVWLPRGRWWNVALGEMVKGGDWHARRYTLDDIPVYVRAGAVIPGQVGQRRLLPGSYRQLLVTAYPGGNGEYRLYEDDGVSLDYQSHSHSILHIKQSRKGALRTVRIEPAKGRFEGFVAKRSLEIRLPGCPPPVDVTAGKRALDWRYDGDTATVIASMKSFDATRGTTVQFYFSKASRMRAPEGWAGLVRRLQHAGRLIRQISVFKPLHARERQLPYAAHVGRRMTLNPERYREELNGFKQALKSLPGDLKGYRRAVKDWPFDRKGMRTVLDKAIALTTHAVEQSGL